MKDRVKVLFLCVHNSARSQMGEAWVKSLGGGLVTAESAGLTPTAINPLVVEAMKEEGIDLEGRETHSVFDYFREGRLYDYVITVCDESSGNACPVFPGMVRRLHWPFPDPSALTGTHEEKLAAVRCIRDGIREKVRAWLDELIRKA